MQVQCGDRTLHLAPPAGGPALQARSRLALVACDARLFGGASAASAARLRDVFAGGRGVSVELRDCLLQAPAEVRRGAAARPSQCGTRMPLCA